MELSDAMRRHLVDEIELDVKKMKETNDVGQKVYFLSAVFGAAFRVLNIEFDPELVFIHNVTELVHRQLTQRITQATQGQTAPIFLPDNLFPALEGALLELASKIKADEQSHSVLERISNIGYGATGNGIYLYVKGDLKI